MKDAERAEILAMVDEHVDQRYTDLKIQDDAETLDASKKKIGFSCPVCGEVYETLFEAQVCRDQPLDDGGLKVGDIVVVPGAYHRVTSPEGDPWTAFVVPPDPRSTSHFSRAGYHVPYFVVTAKHRENRREHRCLVTLSRIYPGEDGERHITAGWNPANGDGHCAMYRIDGGKHCDEGSIWIDIIQPLLDALEPSEQLKEEAAVLADIRISTRNLL